MKMKNRLARLLSVVQNGAELVDSLLPGDLAADPYDPAHQLFVLCGQGCRAADMFFGDDQEVDGGLGRNVPEGKNFIVFVQFVRRDFSLDDFAEQAVVRHDLSLPDFNISFVFRPCEYGIR